MKVLDTPRTGKLGTVVYYPSPYGQCCRPRIVPRDCKSEAKSRMRSILGCSSAEWSRLFTEDQREHWVTAAQTVPSHPSLNQYSHLSGHQLCVKINATLRLTGKSPLVEPPLPVVFSPNSVGALDILNDPETGVRLRLNVGTLNEDVMVYGQPPCSAGRMKHRRVYYLGLLGPASNNQWATTDLYTARFGQPRPGQKVFIVTCQTRNGWQAPESVFSAIVPPPPPSGKQRGDQTTQLPSSEVAESSKVSSATAKGVSPLPQAVYKRSTRGVQGEHNGPRREPLLSSSCTRLVHEVLMALFRRWRLAVAGVGG